MNIPIGKNFSVDASRHIAVIGGSGMGKSTLLTNLFIQFIRQGNGGLFIDPHGDTAEEIAKLIPSKRADDFIWFDPTAKFVPPFNPFNFATPEELELGKESFFTTIKSLAGSAWGDESARVIINAIDAVCEVYPRPTPVHVFRFMADDVFRERLLNATKNPLLKMFQKQYDDKLRDSEQMSKFSPPINKVSKLMRPAILPVIGQPDSLDFLDIMNNRKIVVCKFSKGRLGDEIAQILGSLVISMVSIAALKREKQKDRPQFMVIPDETPNFVHGGRFGSLLAEARKYRITLVPTLQGTYQVPFMRDILSNCFTQIVFNSSGEDAEVMDKNWLYREPLDDFRPEKITKLPPFRFWCRTFRGENEPDLQKVHGLPALRRQGDEAKATELIQASIQRWGKDRQKVSEQIRAFGIIRIGKQAAPFRFTVCHAENATVDGWTG